MRRKTDQAAQEAGRHGDAGVLDAGWSQPEAGAGLSPEERIEDFLDRLCAPLIPSVPYPLRHQLRREIKEHLLATADAYQELGSGPAQAVGEAIARFGAPGQVSAQWLRAWRSPSGVESARPATVAALKTFSQALLAGFAFLYINDQFVPMLPGEHLPGVMQLVGLPLAAGMLVGARHRRGALGTFYALSAVNVLFSPLAFIDRGQGMVTELALLLAFWIPIGCASAALAGWMRRMGARAARRLPAS